MLSHPWKGCTIVFLTIALFLVSQPCAIAAAQVYIPDPSNPDNTIKLEDVTSGPVNTDPVLFIHGHNPDDPDDGGDLDGPSPGVPNFKKNWIDPLNGLTSFQETLNLPANTALNIEPYYIRFQNQGRSIVADAAEIDEAIKAILQRHDPNYDPSDETSTSAVQAVVIAYSKGTISTRLYLKDLLQQNSSFKPVSDFIAIAPPNHGLNIPFFGSSLAAKQLKNGYSAPFTILGSRRCTSLNDSAATNFIEELNRDSVTTHTMADTHADAVNASGEIPQIFPSEAPGSRAPNAPTNEGVLFVTLYSGGNKDLVGGDHPPGSPHNNVRPFDNTEQLEADCSTPVKQGRALAKNLSPDAVNISVGSNTTGNDIPGNSEIEVHQNTVHACDVIYEALYTAVHHRTPTSLGNRCPTPGSVPEIPSPPEVCLTCFVDFCIRCLTLRLVAIPLIALIVLLLGWRFVKRRR